MIGTLKWNLLIGLQAVGAWFGIIKGLCMNGWMVGSVVGGKGIWFENRCTLGVGLLDIRSNKCLDR